MSWRVFSRPLCGGALALFLGAKALAAEPPNFQEVFDLIRTNAVGVTPAELNIAAVQGFLAKLNTRAWLVESNEPAVQDTNTVGVSASAIFDENYGYIRISRVNAALQEQFMKALAQLSATNKLKGLALDLRFASGTNYNAAARAADQFLSGQQTLFEWGGGVAKSQEKTNAFRAPVTVLVNRFTSGAAEALAAVLRDTDVALLIGTNTAGHASVTKDFKLSTGQTLRIATIPLKLASGAEVLSLKPDIQVDVSPDDERAYFVDAYRVMPRPGQTNNSVASLSVTNKPRRRLNEAELVRMSREGVDPDDESSRPSSSASPVPAKPVVSDPALARAIDLLKALAVVRHTRF
jgi:hypothetical protein